MALHLHVLTPSKNCWASNTIPILLAVEPQISITNTLGLTIFLWVHYEISVLYSWLFYMVYEVRYTEMFVVSGFSYSEVLL